MRCRPGSDCIPPSAEAGRRDAVGLREPEALQRITVTDAFHDPGKQGPIGTGWAWYAFI
jgi:hypothetical protein